MSPLLRASLSAVSILLVGFATQRAPIPNQPLTVCEVLEHLSEYRGQVIEVRGSWNGGDLWGACPSAKPRTSMWPAIELNRFGVRDWGTAEAAAKRASQAHGTKP